MKLLFPLILLLALPALAQESPENPNPMLSEGIWFLAFTVASAAGSVAWPLVRAHMQTRLSWRYRVALDAIATGVAFAWRAGGKEMKAQAQAEGRKLTEAEAKQLRDIAASTARDYAYENGVTHPILENEHLVEPLIEQAVEDAKAPLKAPRPRMRHGHKAVST